MKHFFYLALIFISVNITVDAQDLRNICPDRNHPHAIDLGIGVKFACCNVGASAPWEYGGYYAWGETKVKSDYEENSYKYYVDGYYKSLGYDIAGTAYDVAHVNWGGNWRMPTIDQLKLLKHRCNSKWTTYEGVKGRIFTGPNGKSIFLPAAGSSVMGFCGQYWSSTQQPNYSDSAYELSFYSDKTFRCEFTYRYWGLSVRPVIE